MRSLIARFAKDPSGAAAIEYGVIATLIAVILIACAVLIGDQLQGSFTSISQFSTPAG